jgi:hypothetical protein
MLAAGLLGLMLVGVLGVWALRKDGARQRAAAAETTPADPFAGLPPEEPRRRRTEASEVFAGDPSEILAAEAWTTAVARAEEAAALIRAAYAALERGDRAAARYDGGRALELLNQALGESAPWVEEIEARYGADHRAVKRARSQRETWTRDVMALKKSAGL